MKRCSICSKAMPFWQKGTVCKECEDIGKKAEVEEPVGAASCEKEQDESATKVTENETATKNANDEQANNDESFATEKMNSEKRLDEPEMEKFLKELPYKEGEKKGAVIETESNVCAMGIPCSWKTESIFYRVKYLVNVKKVNPSNILCLFFGAIFELHERDDFWIFGFRNNAPICRMSFDDLRVKIILDNIDLIGMSRNVKIISETDRDKWIAVAYKMDIDPCDPRMPDKKTISECKRMLAESGDYWDYITGKRDIFDIYNKANGKLGEVLRNVEFTMWRYIDIQREYELLDFDDLRIIPQLLLSEFAGKIKFDYQYVMVDDIQNIKQDQYALLAAILKKPVNLYVTADFDQNITSMQKLNIDLFDELIKTYHCKVFNFSTAEPNAILRFYGYPNHFVSDAHNKVILKPEKDSWKGRAEEIHARTLRNLTIQICDLIDEEAEPIVYGDNDVEEHSIAIVYQNDRVADAIKKELSDINHGTLYEDKNGAKHGGRTYVDFSASDNVLDRKIVKCFLAAVGMIYRDNPYDYSTYVQLIQHKDCYWCRQGINKYCDDAIDTHFAITAKEAKRNHRTIPEQCISQGYYYFKDVINAVSRIKEDAKTDTFGRVLNEITNELLSEIFSPNEEGWVTVLTIENVMEFDFGKTHNIPYSLNRIATYTRTPYALSSDIRFFKYPDAYGHKFTHVFLVDFHEGPCTVEEEKKREKLREQKKNMRYTAASMATDVVYFCDFDYFQGADGQKKCTLY